MVRLLKLIASIILLFLFMSCFKQNIKKNKPDMNGDLSILIENDSLYYDTGFDDQNIVIQKVNFKLINHTDKTYALAFEPSFFRLTKTILTYKVLNILLIEIKCLLLLFK